MNTGIYNMKRRGSTDQHNGTPKKRRGRPPKTKAKPTVEEDEIAFIGEPIRHSKNRLYYEGVQIGNDKFFVDNIVTLNAEEDALFVAQIIALYLNSDDTSFALCKWFYTKEEAEYKPLKVPVGDEEDVFESTHADDNAIGCIIRRVEVTNVLEKADHVNVFYCCRSYDNENRLLKPLSESKHPERVSNTSWKSFVTSDFPGFEPVAISQHDDIDLSDIGNEPVTTPRRNSPSEKADSTIPQQHENEPHQTGSTLSHTPQEAGNDEQELQPEFSATLNSLWGHAFLNADMYIKDNDEMSQLKQELKKTKDELAKSQKELLQAKIELLEYKTAKENLQKELEVLKARVDLTAKALLEHAGIFLK